MLLVILTWAAILTLKVALFVGAVVVVIAALQAFDTWYSEKMIARFFDNQFGKAPRRKPHKIHVVDDSHLD